MVFRNLEALVDNLKSLVRLLFDCAVVRAAVNASLHLFAVVNDALKHF